MEYNRVMLGKGGMYAAQCLKEGFIGVDFDIYQDLSDMFKDEWKASSALLVPLFQNAHPDNKSRVAAGLSCGYMWKVCHWLKIGDIVLCPNGEGKYYVGEISGDYYFVNDKDAILPHRRNVNWYDPVILRSDMSDKLRHSTGSIGTCCDITKYSDEIQALLNGTPLNLTVATTPALTPAVVKNYKEKALHKILCSYIREYHDVYAKTIAHEQSSTNKEKEQKWLHPDIIGVHFAETKTECTRDLMRVIEPEAAVTLYSFEMKREIHTDSELKEYYFQALSNSNWANRGYLVALYINENLQEEMARLNNAFGIGIIRLQPENADTEILFQAKHKDELDFITIDKICNANPDFRAFMRQLTKFLRADKEYAADAKAGLEKICDDIFSNPGEVEDYCKANNIPY